MTISKEEAKIVMNEVMKKAGADKNYRKLALKDAKAAVKEVAPDLKLPVDLEFKFVESQSEVDNPETTFVLPKLQKELSDEDLDRVVGGVRYHQPRCFLTTATCNTLGKGDDCEELTVLRGFRDNWLKKQSYGPELIEEYYEIAPGIVEEIENKEDSESIYNYLWENYIKVCYEFILQKEHKRAVDKYKEMVYELQRQFVARRQLG